METRVLSPLLRLLPILPVTLVLVLLAAAAAGSGVSRGAPGGRCEPQTWKDWHVAVKAQCVTRTYVCHNMTSSRLLQDPRVAGAYEDALASNDRARIAEMDILIGQIRTAYGCGGAPDGLPNVAPSRALPRGHPPIPRGPARAEPPMGLDRTI
jgi:hypothetical protein